MPERAGHGTRDPGDYYATHPDLCALACRTLAEDYPELQPRSVLEPGCGAGTFLAALQEAWPAAGVVGVEIHEDLAAYSRARGFTVERDDLLTRQLGRHDLIMGNPPFKHLEPLVPLLLRALAPGGKLVLLLRLNFLATQGRFAMWTGHPPERVYVIPARPGFTPDGSTDATDYMLCVWGAEPAAETKVRWLDTRGVRVRWDGKPERIKAGQPAAPAVLDPAFPDPRRDAPSSRVPPAVPEARRVPSL